MRKLLKLLIPLLIIALLVFGGYLFFFQFSPETTASIFVHWGNAAIDSGDFDRANTWFSRAYRLDPTDTGLAITLADSCFSVANYNKAEFYLLDALRREPDNVELYLKLCQVFVAQDKLLDAMELLDSPDAPAQLQSLRPEAPRLGLEPGSYADYLEVPLCAEGGVIYASVTGDFPSVASGVCTQVTLPAGATSVTAITVSPDGLVSSLTSGRYVVSGVIEEVHFADAAVEAALREMLYKSPQARVMSNELWEISELVLPEQTESLDDLRYLVGLVSLTIPNLPDCDLSPLSELEKLSEIYLSNCSVSVEQLQTLGQLEGLKVLDLSGCGLSSVAPLADASSLEVLNLSENYISDLTPLNGCKRLNSLDLSRNGITRVDSLSGLTELTTLNLSFNQISDADPLKTCIALQELDLSHNKLTSVDCISRMPTLRIFSAAANQLTFLCDLSNCTDLERIDVSENLLEEIDGVENLVRLRYMNLNYNDVRVLPEFAEGCQLQQFYAAHNFLEDITGLSGLVELNYVDVDYNNVSSIDCLTNCPNIVQINAFRTNVTDVSAFDGMSVILNYSPQ